jgi:site-specific DNA recombinase
MQDLADQGVDVRFTQESVNLGSNEGKLTGDFLAVISAHYIRNLREEVKKGIHERLKQGLYPGPAPFGYLNQGGGKPKIPDPARSPYVRQIFELYASGSFTLRGLSNELYQRGLRGRTGGKVGPNRLSEILRNPFYVGVIKLKRSGECYPTARGRGALLARVCAINKVNFGIRALRGWRAMCSVPALVKISQTILCPLAVISQLYDT